MATIAMPIGPGFEDAEGRAAIAHTRAAAVAAACLLASVVGAEPIPIPDPSPEPAKLEMRGTPLAVPSVADDAGKATGAILKPEEVGLDPRGTDVPGAIDPVDEPKALGNDMPRRVPPPPQPPD